MLTAQIEDFLLPHLLSGCTFHICLSTQQRPPYALGSSAEWHTCWAGDMFAHTQCDCPYFLAAPFSSDMKLKRSTAVANTSKCWLLKNPACPSLWEIFFHQKGVTAALKLIYIMSYGQEQLQCLKNVLFIIILGIKSVESSLFAEWHSFPNLFCQQQGLTVENCAEICDEFYSGVFFFVRAQREQ